MKITKSNLRKIILEEYQKLKNSGLINEAGMYNKHASRRAPIATYGQQIDDALRSNQLPPPSSNWHAFAKAMDIGVMDLDDLSRDMGYKSFPHMDAAISPRGLSDAEVDDVVDLMYDMNGTREMEVLDALSLPYGS